MAKIVAASEIRALSEINQAIEFYKSCIGNLEIEREKFRPIPKNKN